MLLQLKELLLQSLMHERGGVLIYRTALECVVHDELRGEWERYLSQTEHHVEVLTRVCTLLGLDPGEMTPGCQIVRENGKALVVAMKRALAAADPAAAQINEFVRVSARTRRTRARQIIPTAQRGSCL